MIFLIEADNKIDNIIVSTTAFSPFVHKEDFESTYDDGLSGPYLRYYYNPSGDRAMKISPEGVTKYITDGNMNVLSEYGGDGNLNYNYIYGNGQKLARIDASGTKEYIHNDYLGSVRRISDQSGNLVWGRDYYPFGEDRLTYGGTNEDNSYTYEGKEKDLETDLWYNTARFFNDAGRFTQPDPLWAKYPNISPYVRVANNPMRFVDVNGNEYNLNKAERKLVLRSPRLALKVNNNRNKATKAAKSLNPKYGSLHNGGRDAFRHAYWNALNARDIGGTAAKLFGDAHEENPNQPKEEKEMDLSNNEAGRKVGEENPDATDEEIVEIITEMLENEELEVIEKENKEKQN